MCFGLKTKFEQNLEITIFRLFFRFPHLTLPSILWCNEWFYKVNYEHQICLAQPN